MAFRILFQDESLIAIDKPSGFHVHPPEDTQHRIPKHLSCLHLLRDQIGQYLYPVHRLDRATSGVLLFALSSDIASRVAQMFQSQQIQKKYVCVTRGWVDSQGQFNRALKSSTDPDVTYPSVTDFFRLAQIEIPVEFGRYSTARYSLVQADPKTGRMHQIRRHFAHSAHPLIGDTVYGSGEHNRFFREKLAVSGLLLKAYSIQFPHPITGQEIRIFSKWNKPWHSVFDLFGLCPYLE